MKSFVFNFISKIHPLLYLFFLIPLLAIFYFDGAGLEADSIHHYLISKYAINHPELLIDHWGKPLYTTFSMPFAQFGFKGTQLFNWLCQCTLFLYLWKISKELDLKNPILSSLFYFLFPLTIINGYFGYTEPLCATVLILALYYLIKKKYIISAVLISLTPFIRSEGLILIGAFALYFLYKKEFKSIVFLGLGHLLFSIIGLLFGGENFFWVFNKIPYASLDSPYGSGNLFHFADKLIYMTGVPLLILYLLGFLLIARKPKQNEIITFSLIVFLFFFLAHSLFWYFGIFNSMGLKRVFGAVSPIMALVCLYGFNFILQQVKNNKLKALSKYSLLFYVLIFPFTSNPAAVEWNRDLRLSPPQIAANKVALRIDSLDLNRRRHLYADIYLAEALNRDPFDKKNRLILSEAALKEMKKGDIVIWDNWHAITDFGISLEELESHMQLTLLFKLEDYTNSRPVIYAVFEN